MPRSRKLAKTQFGYFDVPAREYVITSPGTPSPWINYLGLEGELCGIISSTGGGPTWLRDPLELRITRYMQSGSAKDRPGRYLYVRDNETGRFWSATYQPVTSARPRRYECRHGLGYTRIESLNRGIRTSLLHFIPMGAAVEIQRVAVKNEGKSRRRLSLFTYREFVNSTASNDLYNCQFSQHIAQVEVDAQDGRVLYVTTPSEGPRPTPFFAVSERPAGFDTRCATFLGDGSIEDPQVVREGRARNSIAGDDTAVGVFQIDLDLAPGEEKVFHVLTGMAKRAEIRGILDAWLGNDERALAALEELKCHAAGLLDALQCSVPDPYMEVMVNTWNAYQCWINFLFSRSISARDNGIGRSMGTRDSLQDLLGYMHLAPKLARQRILEIVRAVQLQNGACRHQYSALTKRGSDSIGFSDDHLWIPLAVAAYVKETNDYAILSEQLPYSDNEGLTEDLYAHLLRAIQYSFSDLGPNGLPRLRSADWNDTIGDGPDDEVSESVLVAIMLAKMARETDVLTPFCGRPGVTVRLCGAEAPVSTYLTHVADVMTETVNRVAWLADGWYGRGTDGKGEWFGVPARAEGKIFLEPQAWAVMAGVAEGERASTAMDSVNRLLATPYGVQILAPGCSVAPSGNFHVFPKGSKENGGIFCHPNPWAMVAETMLGRGDLAFDYYRRILPPAASEPDATHYSAEPYVYAQIRYGKEHVEYGKAAGTWLTGACAWNYVAASQHILGVRPDWEGLRVDPCVPAAWRKFAVTRKFRGATYRISVRNPKGVCKGVKSVKVDGKRIEGNLLPVFAGGEHRVEVVMG